MNKDNLEVARLSTKIQKIMMPLLVGIEDKKDK